MPIRINLLAEAQAIEDSRRRDPVKRLAYYGALVAALAFAVSSWFQLRVMLANRDLGQVQSQIAGRTNECQIVLSNQKKISAAKMKLAALQKLTAARFLEGNLLNALQHATVDGVALTRLRVQQTYTASNKGAEHAKSAKQATVSENIVVILDAQDASANPGDQVNKFKDALAGQAYFKSMLSGTNGVLLTDLSAPQVGPTGQPFVSFTIECHYPDYKR